MASNDDDAIRSAWHAQPIDSHVPDPEALRRRAQQFEAKARRSVRINQLCAAIVMPLAAAGMFLQDGGLLINTACVMLLIISAYMVWAFRYFFSALPVPEDAGTQSCVNVHRRQLERQRDMHRSARSAGPLVFPVVILTTLARHWPNADTYVGGQAWGFTVAFLAGVYFLMQMGFTYSDLIAHRLQREIDEFDSMLRAPQESA